LIFHQDLIFELIVRFQKNQPGFLLNEEAWFFFYDSATHMKLNFLTVLHLENILTEN